MNNKTTKYTGIGDLKINDQQPPVIYDGYTIALLQNKMYFFVILSNRGYFAFDIRTITQKVGVQIDDKGFDLFIDPQNWLIKQLEKINKKSDVDILDLILSCC